VLLTLEWRSLTSLGLCGGGIPVTCSSYLGAAQLLAPSCIFVGL